MNADTQLGLCSGAGMGLTAGVNVHIIQQTLSVVSSKIKKSVMRHNVESFILKATLPTLPTLFQLRVGRLNASLSTTLPILVEWRRIWRDTDHTLGHFGRKGIAAAASETPPFTRTGGAASRPWGVNGHNISPKEDAARETTCAPNASWKLGRALAVNYTFSRTTEVSVTDLEDLDLQTAIMDEDNQGMIYSVQFRPLNWSCFCNNQETCASVARWSVS